MRKGNIFVRKQVSDTALEFGCDIYIYIYIYIYRTSLIKEVTARCLQWTHGPSYFNPSVPSVSNKKCLVLMSKSEGRDCLNYFAWVLRL